MRASPLLVPLAFSLLAFSGCLDPESAGGPGASAMDLRSAADREAAAWDGSATLLGIVGAEWNRSVDDMEFQEASPSEDGEDIGDGETPGWSYVYASDDGRVVVVTVLDDGTASLADEWEGEDDGSSGLGEWRIDSDEAARRLAEANGTFSQRIAAGAQVGWSLFAEASEEPVPEMHDHEAAEQPMPESQTVWLAAVIGPDEGAMAIFRLDALDGSFLGSFDQPVFGLDLDPESGSSAGTLTVATPAEATPFPIEAEGHPNLRVRFSATGSAIATVRVLGPGLPAPVEAQWGPLPGDVEIDVPMPMAGEWQVEVQMDVGTVLPYEIEWCAEGASMGIPQDCN